MIYSVCLDAYFKSNINININIKTKVSSLNHLLLEFIIWDIYEPHYWTPPMFMFSLFRRLSKCPPFSVNLQRDLRGDLWVQIMIIDKHSDGTQHSTTPRTVIELWKIGNWQVPSESFSIVMMQPLEKKTLFCVSSLRRGGRGPTMQ